MPQRLGLKGVRNLTATFATRVWQSPFSPQTSGNNVLFGKFVRLFLAIDALADLYGLQISRIYCQCFDNPQIERNIHTP